MPLTPREKELAELIAEGQTNKYICEKLIITSHTIKAHICNIYNKYGLKNYDKNEFSVKRLRFALLYLNFKRIFLDINFA